MTQTNERRTNERSNEWADKAFRLKAVNATLLEALEGAAHTMESVARDTTKQNAFVLRNHASRLRAAIKAATEG